MRPILIAMVLLTAGAARAGETATWGTWATHAGASLATRLAAEGALTGLRLLVITPDTAQDARTLQQPGRIALEATAGVAIASFGSSALVSWLASDEATRPRLFAVWGVSFATELAFVALAAITRSIPIAVAGLIISGGVEAAAADWWLREARPISTS